MSKDATQTTFYKDVHKRAKDILAWKRGQDSGDDLGSDYKDCPALEECLEDAEKEVVYEWFCDNKTKFLKMYDGKI